MVIWGQDLVTVVVDLVNAGHAVVVRVLLTLPVVFNSDIALSFGLDAGGLGEKNFP